MADNTQTLSNDIIKNVSLDVTTEMMNSDDFKERFKGEYYQLLIRQVKLNETLTKYQAGTLAFTPKCDYNCLHTQYVYMSDYLKMLTLRAKIEDINLELTFDQRQQFKDSAKANVEAAKKKAAEAQQQMEEN